MAGLLLLFIAGGLLVHGLATGRMLALGVSPARGSQPILFWVIAGVYAVAALVGGIEAAG